MSNYREEKKKINKKENTDQMSHDTGGDIFTTLYYITSFDSIITTVGILIHQGVKFVFLKYNSSSPYNRLVC